MFDKSQMEASTESINILIVIDTEYVKRNYPNPSQDPNNPTGIDHNSQFMICTGARAIEKGTQGTADLSFTAQPGDYLSVFGQSIYANADDAVIIYELHHWKGDEVFNSFNTDAVVRQKAVQPNTDTPNGLPAVQNEQTFISLDSRVKKSGEEYFKVRFALYTLVGGEVQELFGYYSWDPKITVT